jgi:DNA-binding SARP family transcriptional activator
MTGWYNVDRWGAKGYWMEAIWRVSMLGGLEARRGELMVSHFGTRKAAALLAYLAYFGDRPHSRELLAERLWPDEDAAATRDRFRQALSALRRLLEPEGTAPGSVLMADRTDVRLARDAVVTDVAEFELALEAAEEGDSGERGARLEQAANGYRAERLEQAVSAYRGELLPGFYEDWIAPERERLAERYREGLIRLSALREAQGESGDAIEMLRRAVTADPLREEAHASLMRLYGATGRLSDAIRQYRTLERVLKEQIQSHPSLETQALLAQLRAGFAPGTQRASVEADDTTPVSSIRLQVGSTARSGPLDEPSPLFSIELEAEGGAVPLDSNFYLVRPVDREFQQAIHRHDSIVLVKGARQMGKTSLLARGLQRARQAGEKVVLCDLQKLTAAQMETADALFFTVAETIAEQLGLDVDLESLWSVPRGWNVKFERFLRREALGKLDTHVVWGLDEADRLFGRPYCGEVFGLFRSWHNERSLNPEGPWSRLTLAIAYATEAHLFITDLNQSPFNVGTRLALDDFTQADVEELNRRYGSPLRDEAEFARFHALVGGHPYLVRRGLHALASRASTIDALEREGSEEYGVYGDHLRRMLSALSQDAALRDTVRGLLRGQAIADPDQFYRLRAAGLLAGRSEQEARIRCRLYGDYLRRALP